MFFTLFVIGAGGFGAMLLLSFGHFGGGHHGFHVSHGARLLPGGHHGGGGSLAHRASSGLARAAGSSQNPTSWLSRVPWQYLFITPLDVFALCLGFGGAGLILSHFLSGAIVVWLAVLCAILYNYAVMRPFIGLLLRFASRESDGLEGLVSAKAEALGHFDAEGRGIVRLTLDGQFIQLLATLDEGEIGRGVTVNRGDELIVLEVDAKRNRCRVSRDLAA